MPVVLFVAFIVVPLVELAVIMQVGNVIGILPTILLLVTDSLVGAWLVKREGMRAWRSLTSTLSGGGGSPVDELTQGALIVFGGALLLTPGFVTDLLGLACVLPLTRPTMSSFVRRVASMIAARRLGAGRGGTFGGFMGSGGSADRRGHRGDDESDGEPGRRPVRPTASRDSGTGRTRQDGADVPDVEVVSVERNDE